MNKPAAATELVKRALEPSISGSTASTIIPPFAAPVEVKPTPGINEHHRRLMAALAAMPIEGVENWGIPEEPSTPCDADRAVCIM